MGVLAGLVGLPAGIVAYASGNSVASGRSAPEPEYEILETAASNNDGHG